MQLLYHCEVCNNFIVIHTGDMSKIPFSRLPTIVLEASRHRCKRKATK